MHTARRRVPRQRQHAVSTVTTDANPNSILPSQSLKASIASLRRRSEITANPSRIATISRHTRTRVYMARTCQRLLRLWLPRERHFVVPVRRAATILGYIAISDADAVVRKVVRVMAVEVGVTLEGALFEQIQ